MKKTLKTFGVLVIGYTIGEYITGYRYQDVSTSFKEYTKTYFRTIPEQYRYAYDAGAAMATNPSDARTIAKDLTHRKFN